jgi:hypothetical protein
VFESSNGSRAGFKGRTYILWLRATDAAGNESEPVSVLVTVPHDQRRKTR